MISVATITPSGSVGNYTLAEVSWSFSNDPANEIVLPEKTVKISLDNLDLVFPPTSSNL